MCFFYANLRIYIKKIERKGCQPEFSNIYPINWYNSYVRSKETPNSNHTNY